MTRAAGPVWDDEVCYDVRSVQVPGGGRALISIGIVRGDARYYAVNACLPGREVVRDARLMAEVVPCLPRLHPQVRARVRTSRNPLGLNGYHESVKRPAVIGREVRAFLDGGPRLRLWSWGSGSQHEVLAALLGEPAPWCRTRDVRDALSVVSGGVPQPGEGECHALAGAVRVRRWVEQLHELTKTLHASYSDAIV